MREIQLLSSGKMGCQCLVFALPKTIKLNRCLSLKTKGKNLIKNSIARLLIIVILIVLSLLKNVLKKANLSLIKGKNLTKGKNLIKNSIAKLLLIS